MRAWVLSAATLIVAAFLAGGGGVRYVPKDAAAQAPPKVEPRKEELKKLPLPPPAEPLLPLVEPPPAGSPNAAQEAAVADLERVYANDRERGKGYDPDAPFMRYFWVTTEPKHRNDFLVVFCAHLNKLSNQGKFSWPTFVAPDLLRIDVRDYGWDTNGVILVHERTAEKDFFFHQQAVVKVDLQKDYERLPVAWPGGKDGKREYERGIYQLRFRKGDTVALPAAWLDQTTALRFKYLTYSESPLLCAEWFFVQTARQTSLTNNDEPGIGYYDYVALKNRDDFFKLCGVDVAAAERLFRKWSAVVLDSGISEQNRQIVRLGAVGEFVWGTLDTFNQSGRGVLQRNLRKGEFLHDAEEWYGRLPNGLDVTLLANAKGDRQATAPDKIGPDRSKLNLKLEGNDYRVHSNLSCVRCHGADDFLRDIDDWARDTFKRGGPLVLSDPDKRVKLELESEYLRDINRLLRKDRNDYVESVKEVTTSKLNPAGLVPLKFAELYSDAWDRYAKVRVTPAIAARELGVAEEALMKGVRAHASLPNRGQGDNLLSTWLVNKGGIRRTAWEASYALAMSLALGLAPPEERIELRVKDPLEKKK